MEGGVVSGFGPPLNWNPLNVPLTDGLRKKGFGDEADETETFVVLLAGNIFGDEIFVFEAAAVDKTVNLRVRNRIEIAAENTERESTWSL